VKSRLEKVWIVISLSPESNVCMLRQKLQIFKND